jgi:hypothetical protein
MYNKKRSLRECLNQVLIYDPLINTYGVVKTKGITALPRRDHCSSIFSKYFSIFISNLHLSLLYVINIYSYFSFLNS